MKQLMVCIGVLFGTVLLFPLTGCSDDESAVPVAPELGQGAQVRVVHASPDAPSVDIYANGGSAPVLSGLAYGQASPYLDVTPGEYVFEIRAAGAPASAPAAFTTGTLTLDEGAKVSALAVGLLASSNPDDQFRVLPLREGFASPGAGKAAVRIVHGAPDAPTVAIDLANDGAPELTGVSRFAESGPSGVALPANQALQVAIWAGTPLARVTVFTTPALPEGAELFFVATGLLSRLPREADGFSLLAVGPSGTVGLIKQNPTVFALHGSPDAPPVDLYAGEAELVDNLAFAELSGAIQIPPGRYDLSFRAHDNGPVAATATTPTLLAGERYLAVASGFLSPEGTTPSFTLLPFAEEFTLGNAAPQVRVVHASPDAPAVDVGTVSGGSVTPVPDFRDLNFTQSSAATGTPLPTANLQIGVAQAGQTTPVATFDITTTAGIRVFAVAAGALGADGEAFRLVLVDTSVFPWVAAGVLPNP